MSNEQNLQSSMIQMRQMVGEINMDKDFLAIVMIAQESDGGYNEEMAWINNKVSPAVMFDLLSKFFINLASAKPEIFLALMLKMPEFGLAGREQAKKEAQEEVERNASDELLNKASEETISEINGLLNKILRK